MLPFWLPTHYVGPMNGKSGELTPEKIESRMVAGIRRALDTPPSPTKTLVGKTERAKNQRESREIRARRAKPESGEAS
jgi:hypothetical protein